MASIRKVGTKWQVQIAKNGVRSSKSFVTKAAAMAWAVAQENEIDTVQNGGLPNKTFGELLERYRDEVVPTVKKEVVRINRFVRDEDLAKVKVASLNSTHVATWRNKRLLEVSSSSVRREWNTLSHACTVAIKEWKWLKTNPFADATQPADAPPRTRMFTDDEVFRLVYASGYQYDSPPEEKTARVGAALLFALETAARSGEICALTWEHVHSKYIHLPKTKNGRKRDVPLSAEAKRILAQLKGVKGCEVNVFGINDASRDALFRKIKDRCGIEDLHFHDARRTALTRLAKIFDVMELARISGHLDLKILMSVYYTPSIEDLADKL